MKILFEDPNSDIVIFSRNGEFETSITGNTVFYDLDPVYEPNSKHNEFVWLSVPDQYFSINDLNEVIIFFTAMRDEKQRTLDNGNYENHP